MKAESISGWMMEGSGGRVRRWGRGAVAGLWAGAAIWSGVAQAEEWYVSPGGWHANSGRSLAEAWPSIPYAMLQVSDGDTIWVDAGVYEVASDVGHPLGSELPVRWAIYKAVTVRSLYGAEHTIVMGQRHSEESPLGEYAMRAVYLGNNAMLIGVTISNGHTRVESTNAADVYGGGIYAESASASVYDCVIRDCSAGSMGGGVYQGAYHRTRIAHNSVPFGFVDGGGGAAQAWLYDSQVVSNTFMGNLIVFFGMGGGAYQSTLYNCLVQGNQVVSGCGGGLYGCQAYNCILQGNQATMWNEQDASRTRGCGGGARESELHNCTVVANYAQKYGGGADGCGNVVNTIVVSNQAGWASANHIACFMAYSCAQPAPTGGVGNADWEPGFADYAGGNLRLASGSPCRDAGTWESWMFGWPWDYEGADRVSGAAPDMGAYELSEFAFSLTAVSVRPGVGVVLSWESEPGYHYHLRRSGGMEASFTDLITDIPGAAGSLTVTDTTAGASIRNCYGVRRTP